MDDVSFGRSDQLSVLQYHFKMFLIAFCLISIQAEYYHMLSV